MGQLTTVCVTLCVVLCYFQARGADKYTDENRPYEFGFKIDGEQHRHEKKDENGIIMGEFGFITADGVYHVTVYATDENGNFKILSMKNIRVKPYPTSNNVGERKGHSLSVPSPPSQHLSTPHVDVPPASSQPLKSSIATKVQQPKQESNSIARSCSHCRIPTTTTPPPKLAVITTNENYPSQDQNYGNKESNVINQEEFNVGRKYLQNTRTQPDPSLPNQKFNSLPQTGVGLNYQQGFNGEQRQNQLNIQSQNDNYKQAGYSPVAEQNYIQGQRQNQLNIQGQNQLNIQGQNDNQKQPGYAPVAEQNYSQRPNTNDNNVQNQYRNQPEYISITKNNSPQGITSSVTSITSGDRQQKSFKDILQAVSPQQQDTSIISPSIQQNNEKPVLVAAQMQLVDKDTNIYHKNPGEVDGLPKGLSKGDMSQLLYTFNYTVGFHGHHEEGYRNGDKIGYYYVTGRNGIRTRVDYVADDKGFHPRISQEALDIQSDEVPKAETEKDEKYGLKGYEFKWLYYPVDSN